LGALLLLPASLAWASPESDAKDLFTRGRELRAQGDCAGAASLFQKAIEVFPAGLGSLRNLAECDESLSHWASARRAWLDLKRALQVYRDPKYAGWEQDADAASLRLAPKVAMLTIDVEARGTQGQGPLAPNDHVELLLNGEKVDRALLGTEVERDPGTYRVRAQGADAAEAVEQEVVLAAGSAKHVTLVVTLRSPQPSQVAAAPVQPTPPSTPNDRSGLRTAGYIAIGAGVASLVGAGVSLGVRQSALSSVESACPQYQTRSCDPSLGNTVDRGQLASVLVDVFGALAVLGIGGGVALVLLNPKPAQTTGIVVRPKLGGLDVEWRY